MLEICCTDIESVRNALEGGAYRIELCSALEVGGLTPSFALLGRTLWLSSRLENPIKVHLLIRPRPGDFYYSDREIKLMAEDAAYAVESGVDGLVFGALTPDGEVDEYACSKILESAARAAKSGQEVALTFHRAFDFVKDPFKALETIENLSFNRILTSGQAVDAWSGRELIADLVRRASPGMTIMAGGGITPDNVAALIGATGVRDVHASAKVLYHSKMECRNERLSTGDGSTSDYDYYRTSAEVVKELSVIVAQSSGLCV
ncbi:MAG: copper homeostasis protein CutC [Clostridium sp.]|nr:copper homeostasis protein CutC [Prevotella sp.]MCM1428810.1 copper homeostasis protein CutC [Clostridium sp.]